MTEQKAGKGGGIDFCQRTCQDTKVEFGDFYYPCPHKPKFKVKYERPVKRGVFEEEVLCGKHFRYLEKSLNKLNHPFEAEEI